MSVNMIVAMTSDRVIGKAGQVPWRIKDDIRLFRELTTSNVVIMGRNTWNSLPERFRPLPERINIIVSGTLEERKGAIVCRSVSAAMETSKNYKKETFCIGGRQLYASMLPFTEILHISWVREPYKGDVYFPEINLNSWRETETKEFNEFSYKRYMRKNSA